MKPFDIVFAEPSDLIIQPEVDIFEHPLSNLVSAGVLFGGESFQALFALMPPQLLNLTYRGAPADKRVAKIKKVMEMLEESSEKLTELLLSNPRKTADDAKPQEVEVTKAVQEHAQIETTTEQDHSK